MVKAKKIISKIISGGFEVVEVVKDSAKQIAGTVTPIPEKLVEAVAGTTTPPKKDELGEYLKNLSDTSPQKLKEREKELSSEEQKELEETRKVLRAAVPPHMRPKEAPPETSIYDKLWQEKKEREEVLEKSQTAQQSKFEEPTTVPRRGDWRKGQQRRKAVTGIKTIETKVNIKTG